MRGVWMIRNEETNAFSFGFLRNIQLFDSFSIGYDTEFIIYSHINAGLCALCISNSCAHR